MLISKFIACPMPCIDYTHINSKKGQFSNMGVLRLTAIDSKICGTLNPDAILVWIRYGGRYMFIFSIFLWNQKGFLENTLLAFCPCFSMCIGLCHKFYWNKWQYYKFYHLCYIEIDVKVYLKLPGSGPDMAQKYFKQNPHTWTNYLVMFSSLISNFSLCTNTKLKSP